MMKLRKIESKSDFVQKGDKENVQIVTGVSRRETV